MQRILFLSFALSLLCLLAVPYSSGADIKNPLVHWALDGDGKDSIGSNHLPIESGDFEAGKYGQALSLDGSGSHAVDEGGADYINQSWESRCHAPSPLMGSRGKVGKG